MFDKGSTGFGGKLYENAIQEAVRAMLTDLPEGCVRMGDGPLCDCYTAPPGMTAEALEKWMLHGIRYGRKLTREDITFPPLKVYDPPTEMLGYEGASEK